MHFLEGQTEHLDEQAFGDAVLAHDLGGVLAAAGGELQVAVARHGEQAVALHPGDGLGDRGAALAQALGDPGAQGDDPLLLELEHRAEVHLRGVDEIAHPGIQPHPACPHPSDALACDRARRRLVPPRPAAG